MVDSPPSMRANRCRINELFILDDPEITHPAKLVALSLLSKRYKVAVTVGEPDYTAQEWADKHSDDSLCGEMGLPSPQSVPAPATK
jgi:hypothetical protein